MNNVSDANDTQLNEVRGSLYDRFYSPPVGSYAEQFEWIGEACDWSGVGKGDAGGWAAMISPSFYLTASHASGGGPRVFRHGNSVNSPSEAHASAPGFPQGSDLHLGRFQTTVSDQIALYPVYASEDVEDLVGVEIYIVGRSEVRPEFGGAKSLEFRLGRNTVSSIASNDVGNIQVEDDSHYKFTFDVSISDFAGPDGKGDGLVNGLEESIQEANFALQLLSPGSTMFSYIDGDIVKSSGSAGLIDFEDIFQLGEDTGFLSGTNGGSTGGLGWDEAVTQGGDSGGPTFALFDNKPAVIGVHSGADTTNQTNGQDAYAGHDPTQIVQVFVDESSPERPCFVSFSRKFVLGADGYDLPPGLQENKRVFGDVNGDYRLTTDDILTLEQEIVNHRDHGPYPYNWGFDLDADGDIDVDDMTVLMEQGFKTSRADIASVGDDGRVPEPGGIVDVIADAFVLVGNLEMVNASYLDGDLNLDGTVTVLGDAFILVGELGTHGMLRLNPDFNADGVLDAEDIDLLTPALHPTNPAPYDPMFDLTTSMLAADGVTVIPNPDAAAVPDGLVDMADLLFYVETILGARIGDTNFDGVVTVLSDVEFSNLGQPGGWAEGDLNFDGVITIEDFVVLQELYD